MSRFGFAMALVLCASTAGCDCGPCDEALLLPSGDYTLTERLHNALDPGPAWLEAALPGAQLQFDREANLATMRYTRDGTTYEVVFEIE